MAVVMVVVREHREHAVLHEERGLAVGDFLRRSRHAETDSPDALELAGERFSHTFHENSLAGTRCAAYLAVRIDSTWIVLVLASSVPVTLTLCPANCSGVRWSLSV